jgi:ribonuclease P protein component
MAPRVGRLVHRADFDEVLATPARMRSVHFAVHVVPTALTAQADPRDAGSTAEDLSTDRTQEATELVDKFSAPCQAGLVVPKRLARRAVTRNLLRRQMRAALERHARVLPAGRVVVRLRAPFSPADFVSAASKALRAAVRCELDALLVRFEPGISRRAARGPGRPGAA